jgi:hypothetical protein
VHPESELSSFIEKFTPEMQEVIRGCRGQLSLAVIPMEASEKGELIIKSISAKQRPRR